MSPIFDQSEFDIRCEWGPCAVAELSPISDAVIVIDVLSFTTCVEVAVSRGATVFPYRLKDGSAQTFASEMNAELAGPRGRTRYSLSPVSLAQLPDGARIVLPSPNGSTLSLGTGTTPTFAGCLRNASAVARAAMRIGPRIAVVPAGERWKGDDSLRPALEDWLGAGAIVSHIEGVLSPEARAAAETFQTAHSDLPERLLACSSGKELAAKGFASDVELAAELDVSDCVPLLADGAYAAIS
jgi:2-phosphosulfolactate phosphatase